MNKARYRIGNLFDELKLLHEERKKIGYMYSQRNASEEKETEAKIIRRKVDFPIEQMMQGNSA